MVGVRKWVDQHWPSPLLRRTPRPDQHLGRSAVWSLQGEGNLIQYSAECILSQKRFVWILALPSSRDLVYITHCNVLVHNRDNDTLLIVWCGNKTAPVTSAWKCPGRENLQSHSLTCPLFSALQCSDFYKHTTEVPWSDCRPSVVSLCLLQMPVQSYVRVKSHLLILQ